MEIATVLELVKARLGIRTTVRDIYLTPIIESVIKELEDEKGLKLDGTNAYHLMFVVDYATWRYQNKDAEGSIPRHLKFRLHNLIIHLGSGILQVDNIITIDTLPLTPDIKTVYILSDSTKQICIDGIWTKVNLVNGLWVRV